MATKLFVHNRSPHDSHGEEHTVRSVTWPLANGDDGQPFVYALLPQKCFTISGTFGTGGNVILEGSTDAATPVWQPLHDSQGLILNVITTARIVQVQERPYAVRPRVSAGDGTTSLVVSCTAVRA